MSIVHVCDRCGKKLDIHSCPNRKFYEVRIHSYSIESTAINFERIPIDLCESCYKIVDDVLNQKDCGDE